MAYIDDAMNEGAFIPTPEPRRCKFLCRGFEQNVQIAIDGGADLICPRCGSVVEEDINGGGGTVGDE